VHGALIAERNVLEWRFDPASDACLDNAAYDLRVIVVCNEDYTSSLAAAALQDLRISGATDVLGASVPGTPPGRRPAHPSPPPETRATPMEREQRRRTLRTNAPRADNDVSVRGSGRHRSPSR